jgi:hypothetical protein
LTSFYFILSSKANQLRSSSFVDSPDCCSVHFYFAFEFILLCSILHCTFIFTSPALLYSALYIYFHFSCSALFCSVHLFSLLLLCSILLCTFIFTSPALHYSALYIYFHFSCSALFCSVHLLSLLLLCTILLCTFLTILLRSLHLSCTFLLLPYL